MKQSDYDKLLIKWVKNHYWDSLEKDKDLILRHLRTFVGDIDKDAILTSAMHADSEGSAVFEETEYAIDYVDSETIRLTRRR